MTAWPRGERVRLLELTTVFAIGGTERQLVNLANGLDRDRFELHLACLRRWGSFLNELGPQEHPVAEFKISSLYGLRTMKAQLQLAQHLRSNRVQVFHAQGFYPDVFGIPAARLARTPVTITSIRDQGDSRTPLQEMALRVAATLSDAVVVNAEVVKSGLLAKGYDPRKIHVIPNGVDCDRFSATRQPSGLRRELGIPPAAQLVTVLCRLSRVKGLEDFLEAAARVASRIPEAHFLIVGDAMTPAGAPTSHGYRAQLEERAARLGLTGRLSFSGFRLDVPQILAETAVSVLPSLSEALSNTLLESMAAGVPVVATRVGGNPEVVEHQQNGLLVPPRRPEALARAIAVLLKRPELAARYGETGRARVRESYSIARMVQRTERLYLELLEQAQPGARPIRGLSHGPAKTSQPHAS